MFFTTLCSEGPATVEIPPRNVKTVAKFQDILRNAGIFTHIMNILMLPLKCEPHEADGARSDGGTERQPVREHRDRRDLFAKCYDFLRAYVEGNKKNQELAFVHLNHFIDTMGIAGINVADFLRSMLSNVVLLNKIPSEFPRKILELLQVCRAGLPIGVALDCRLVSRWVAPWCCTGLPISRAGLHICLALDCSSVLCRIAHWFRAG